jgi:hypothetical protein
LVAATAEIGGVVGRAVVGAAVDAFGWLVGSGSLLHATAMAVTANAAAATIAVAR